MKAAVPRGRWQKFDPAKAILAHPNLVKHSRLQYIFILVISDSEHAEGWRILFEVTAPFFLILILSFYEIFISLTVQYCQLLPMKVHI